MPPRKRRRTSAPRRATATSSSPDASSTQALPANLVAKIAVRTDVATIVRCAAACKPLRREILNPEFIRRVCQESDAVVPSTILGCLDDEMTFSLARPGTSAAALSFARYHLAPFASRRAADLIEKYTFATSRGGLVALARREVNRRRKSERRSDLCVYDPMTDTRAFFPAPPDIGHNPYHGLMGSVTVFSYVILTAAADGIGCSFMLLAADMASGFEGRSPRVQTMSSSDITAAGGKWSPIVTTDHNCPWWCANMDSYCDAAVVLGGGVVHWLMHAGASFFAQDVREYILTYDINSSTAGSIDLPQERQVAANTRGSGSLLAGSSRDGKLRFLATNGFVVSVWVLAPEGGGWARHAQVDMEAIWSLSEFHPEARGVYLENFGDQRSGAVFLRVGDDPETLCSFDVEAEEPRHVMSWFEKSGVPYEVDFASRLASMKAF
ncbi:hypothetical protein EJB05_03387, partial [Eragrostis curvula]